MIIRRVEDCEDTSRKVASATSASTRLLLAEDKMGFSLNLTEIKPGLKIKIQYNNHLEAVYCVSGTGSIEDIDARVTHSISPGTIYALNQHDAHILRSKTKLELICIFNPALKGSEQRAPGGGYPAP